MHQLWNLKSMMTLRNSANVADAYLERKLRYEYAKLEAEGKLPSKPLQYALASQHENVEATSVAMSSRQNFYKRSLSPATTAGKSSGPPIIRKCQRRMSSSAEELLSFTKLSTRATLPDTCFTPSTKFLMKCFHMVLEIPLLIEQRRWRPVYRRKRTRLGLRGELSP